MYEIVENCSPGPYLELFARYRRPGWDHWGNEVGEAGTAIGVKNSEIVAPVLQKTLALEQRHDYELAAVEVKPKGGATQ